MKTFLAASILAAFSLPAAAQTAIDELATLSQAWMEAAQKHDSATLERLMADDFTLVHPSAGVTTRAQWLATLAKIETTSFEYKHLRVVHYGDAMAIVSSIFVIDAVIDGHKWPSVAALIDVWQKRGGKWQVVTRYAVRPQELPRPKPSASETPGSLATAPAGLVIVQKFVRKN